VAKKILEA